MYSFTWLLNSFVKNKKGMNYIDLANPLHNQLIKVWLNKLNIGFDKCKQVQY